jgi:excisionase family DNA binding protein
MDFQPLIDSLAEQVADVVMKRLAEREAESVSATALIDEPTMAGQLQVSQQTLQRMRVSGEIPHVRLGRRVLYRPSDVLAAITDAS